MEEVREVEAESELLKEDFEDSEYEIIGIVDMVDCWVEEVT